jgi:hypothetical protein
MTLPEFEKLFNKNITQLKTRISLLDSLLFIGFLAYIPFVSLQILCFYPLYIINGDKLSPLSLSRVSSILPLCIYMCFIKPMCTSLFELSSYLQRKAKETYQHTLNKAIDNSTLSIRR